jgi:hypothetical protein
MSQPRINEMEKAIISQSLSVLTRMNALKNRKILSHLEKIISQSGYSELDGEQSRLVSKSLYLYLIFLYETSYFQVSEDYEDRTILYLEMVKGLYGKLAIASGKLTRKSLTEFLCLAASQSNTPSWLEAALLRQSPAGISALTELAQALVDAEVKITATASQMQALGNLLRSIEDHRGIATGFYTNEKTHATGYYPVEMMRYLSTLALDAMQDNQKLA